MSIRLFSQHSTRRSASLEESWTFLFPIDGTEISPDVQRDEARSCRLMVPSVWETIPEYVDYRGQAVACRRIEVAKTGPLRLVFEGVSHTCRVFLDGQAVGGHHNAFTGFVINIPEVAAGSHELRVWITNEHGELSALHVPNDYYNYGGISRPAEMQFPARPVVIERIHATPLYGEEGWRLKVAVALSNFCEKPVGGLLLTVTVAGQSQTVSVDELPTGDAVFELEFCCKDVRCWTPDQPELYEIVAELSDTDGAAFDDLRDRFGFRTIKAVGRELLLNGKALYLIGVNRHEDHPDFGCALPVGMMQRDLAIIRDLGCNMVRTSHYPNDHRFLDLCDELGVLVWEESHARGLFDERSKHPRYIEQTRENTREMVLAHYNHPSIVLWGYLNECDSWTDVGKEAYRVAEATVKAVDHSRPTTYAACHLGKDACQAIPDVLSWNQYPLWYVTDTMGATLDKLAAFLKSSEVEGKPLIFSEFGAGALPGYSDYFRRGKWSEEHQADILDQLLGELLGDRLATGALIWQYCDVRVDPSWAFLRPRSMNNKGIVDEYRRPKQAYAVVRKHFRDKAAGLDYGRL